ncbi:hypothetical protein [Nonomuraea sp. NPDC048826]|uniref:hypothetical protein n=1 Tax=Nonomuraea sp. NPDC048826 TaxID=3364347 RepID=UPI00371BD8B0
MGEIRTSHRLVKPIHLVTAGFAVASACTAAVLISQFTSKSPPVPSSCPQQWSGRAPGGWVPAAAGIGGVEESLVPGDPIQALICAYPGDNTRPGGERLAGSRTLTDQARAMARDLSYLPVTATAAKPLCTLMGGPMTNYLIRFAYPNGEALWVGTAEEVNSCVQTTNGTALTNSYVGKGITAAYQKGIWRLVQPEDPCHGSVGRRGQNEQMVPEGPGKVLVCRHDRYGVRSPRLEYGESVAENLATALNSLETTTSTHQCQGTGAGPDDEFRLLFNYREGPPADVTIVTNCEPAIDNGLLQADLDGSVHDRIIRLAPPA